MPITRTEYFLDSIAKGTPSAIKPLTRNEMYLAYLSGNKSIKLPEPITRDELYLYKLCTSKKDVTVSSAPVVEKDFDFWDYDGTLLYSYTVEEVHALTEMPPLPTHHERLICEGWNYDLDVIKLYSRGCDIGALYHTTSGTTEIDIMLTYKLDTSKTFAFYDESAISDFTSIDWGDGTVDTNLSHTYANYGNYTIKVYGATKIKGNGDGYGFATTKYLPMVKRVFMSETTSIGECAFACMTNLNNVAVNSISKPSEITGYYTFQDCYNLEFLVIPNMQDNVGYDLCLAQTFSLKKIVLPDEITYLDVEVCDSSQSLYGIVHIPRNIKSMGSYCFRNCYSVTEYDFSNHTLVPECDTDFEGIPDSTIITVPSVLYDEWITTDGWTEVADHIVAV